MASLEFTFRWEPVGPDGLIEAERETRKVQAALACLVDFIDGLNYTQLDHVPGLFDKTRAARMVLRDDPIAVEVKARAARNA